MTHENEKCPFEEGRRNPRPIFLLDWSNVVRLSVSSFDTPDQYLKGHTPKSDILPNIAPKIVTPEIYLQIWESSATLIGQLGIFFRDADWSVGNCNDFCAKLGGIPLSGVYPID